MARTFQCKTIPSQWFNKNGYRLDCGPYLSGATEARVILRNLRAKKEPLNNLTDGIINAGRIPRTWVEDSEHGLPFLSSTDILQADISKIKFIAKSAARQNKNLVINERSTLITRSGSVGRMAYARQDMNGMACTEDVLRVVPDETKIKSGYLYSYLSSKFGVPLIVSGTYGAIIQHIEPQHIADLPVPRLGAIECRAHELVQKAADLRVAASCQLKSATAKLLNAAGIEEITHQEWKTRSGQLGFTTSLSSNTLRAINYIPLNRQLCESVKQKSPSWKTLSEITKPGTLKSGLRFKRIDSTPEYGVELIGQGEIANLAPEGRWISKNHLPGGSSVFVLEGTILVSAQGSLGETDSFARCEYITGKRLKYAYSQHFLRVIADETKIPRGALFAYLRSNLAFRLLRSCAIGSMQQDFHPALLSNIPVPIIEKKEADAVDEVVRSAHQKYDDAIDCENGARTLVEQTIEKGVR